jgi:hypothetical protein
VETPPEKTPPVKETPNHPTSPPNAPNTHANQGGGVLGQEQGHGGGGVVQASTAESTLPFTGSDTLLLMLLGVASLGLGLVLHRVSTERG